VQYIFITDTYKTKQEQFDTHFGRIVKDGMIDFNNMGYQFGFDSVLFLLDNLSVEYLYSDPDTVEPSLEMQFYNILNAYREPEEFLTYYIEHEGEEPIFTYHLQINEILLLNAGMIYPLYPDSIPVPRAPEDALLAGSYTYERNFFQVSYDIFINFTNRSQLIMKEMRLILLLAIGSLLLVFTVFFITLQNMIRQKRLSDLKTDFINNMTHELKTPLSTISVASSSLGNRKIIQKEERVEELSELIKRQNRHLSELIDRILDIHIWEKDQVKLRMKEVELESWLKNLTSAFLLDKKDSDLEIDLRINLEKPTHNMDEVHMSTMLNNLLSNAEKYGNRPCRILVEAGHRQGSFALSVSDNGPGIRKEELRHLFEKFYRGTQAKHRVIKGLGLGLFYVKQIAEAHEGSVSVSSQPGKGTRFDILIPETQLKQDDDGFTAG
jgi:signal transduction histidine kinase